MHMTIARNLFWQTSDNQKLGSMGEIDQKSKGSYSHARICPSFKW